MKRGRLEIMRDILEIVHNNQEIKVTPLLRKSNLSFARFSEYFKELVEKEFVKESRNKTNSKFIILTEKGQKFLEKYKTIISFIEEFEL